MPTLNRTAALNAQRANTFSVEPITPAMNNAMDTDTSPQSAAQYAEMGNTGDAPAIDLASNPSFAAVMESIEVEQDALHERQMIIEAQQIEAEGKIRAKEIEDETFRARCQNIKGLAGWIPPAAAVLTAGDTLSALVRGKDLCGDKKDVIHALGDSASQFVSSKLPGSSSFLAQTGKELAVGWATDKVANHISDQMKPKGVHLDMEAYGDIAFEPLKLDPVALESMEMPAFNSNLGSRLAAQRAMKTAQQPPALAITDRQPQIRMGGMGG